MSPLWLLLVPVAILAVVMIAAKLTRARDDFPMTGE